MLSAAHGTPDGVHSFDASLPPYKVGSKLLISLEALGTYFDYFWASGKKSMTINIALLTEGGPGRLGIKHRPPDGGRTATFTVWELILSDHLVIQTRR